MRHFLSRLVHLPRYVRLVLAWSSAADDVTHRKYARAEKKLLRVYELMPAGQDIPLHVNLTMCIACLHLGRPAAAAELALKALRQAKYARPYAKKPADRDYLRYVGKLIYEEATRQDGAPMLIDVGVQSEGDLKLDEVQSHLKRFFPLSAVEPPPQHTLH